jgi:Tfp pilus assembly protein PilP
MKAAAIAALALAACGLGLAMEAQGQAGRAEGRRDPFVSPVRAREGGAAADCVNGKRCLIVSQLTLKGVVRSETGMIAVVENPARRVYFLRENDPLYDGQVVRIDANAMVLRENVLDAGGRVTTREVVKRIS